MLWTVFIILIVDVDAGNGVRLHHGWVHSHPAGLGGRICGDTVDQWPSTRLKHRSQQIEGALEFSRRPPGDLN
jgi:hypothetical protein